MCDGQRETVVACNQSPQSKGICCTISPHTKVLRYWAPPGETSLGNGHAYTRVTLTLTQTGRASCAESACLRACALQALEKKKKQKKQKKKKKKKKERERERVVGGEGEHSQIQFPCREADPDGGRHSMYHL